MHRCKHFSLSLAVGKQVTETMVMRMRRLTTIGRHFSPCQYLIVVFHCRQNLTMATKSTAFVLLLSSQRGAASGVSNIHAVVFV